MVGGVSPDGGDLVARLRRPSMTYDFPEWEEAADEVERLRTDVERLDAALVQQMEDSERLRRDAETWQRVSDHNARIVADQRDQLVKLGAEIERLRAALREIRALHQPEPRVCALCGTADGLWPCSTVATIREVLDDE